MRHVLSEHLSALGYSVDEVVDHATAVRRINERLLRFDDDYVAIAFGWPAVPDADADELAERLELDDALELPVLVMSTDQRAETRAWVAARPRTSLVAWKRYRDVDSVLVRLIDPVEQGESAAVKFDNSDIHVLIVDDSATIRRSLQDLFSQQGYKSLLAADGQAALDIAREQPVDIAIVDFYLGEDTGDRVCRELVSDVSTGDIVCAVLTGTYSDNIIRRSLRAGALECLFKNESSELLLNRLDALSRFVRQRRRLVDERRLLDSVVDLVAGASVVLDPDGSIRYVSQQALLLLGHDDAKALIGHPLSVIAGQVDVPVNAGTQELVLRRADGASTDASAQRRSLAGSLGSLLQFDSQDELADGDDESTAPTTQGREPSPVPASTVRPRGALPAENDPFFILLSRMADGSEPVQYEASLLVLRMWVCSEEGEPEPLGDHPDLEARIAPALSALYLRPGHVASLGDGRFGFLIQHLDGPQSWLITRKLMQLANDSLTKIDGQILASTGSLKRIDRVAGDAGQDDAPDLDMSASHATQILTITLDALDWVDARWSNKALLMDPRRLLAVYPEKAD